MYHYWVLGPLGQRNIKHDLPSMGLRLVQSFYPTVLVEDEIRSAYFF